MNWLKFYRILETPVLLLIAGMFCIESRTLEIGLLIICFSIVRLITNVITDDSVYKKR